MTGLRKHVLIYCNHNFFQNHKINPYTLFCENLGSGGDICMICNKEIFRNVDGDDDDDDDFSPADSDLRKRVSR